jgi:hypothetical protein
LERDVIVIGSESHKQVETTKYDNLGRSIGECVMIENVPCCADIIKCTKFEFAKILRAISVASTPIVEWFVVFIVTMKLVVLLLFISVIVQCQVLNLTLPLLAI